MSGGQLTCPIVFRGPNASARQVGSQHSHAMEHFYATVPGLKVVAPAFPKDAKGLMKAAIRDDNPVLVMESETLYSIKGDVPDDLDTIPLGEAQIVRPGTDVTLVGYSRMTHVCTEAAVRLEKEGVSCEVLDLRSLRPLDEGALVASVKKTHRCVVVHEGWPYGGVGAEIADRVQRLAFDWLDGPILRVTTLDVPMPYNRTLEDMCMPQAERVVATVKRALARGRA
jgi:pyruvate dehydrogenase E1 component beta subunit